MPPDERRAAIVEATLPLVHEHGNGVTVRMIAEAAGVAEGTIFTVFRDKDALMTAVRDRAFDAEPALRELDAIDPELPLRRRLHDVVRIVSGHLQEAFLLIAALGFPMPKDGDEAAVRRNAVNERFRAAIIAVIEPDAADLVVAPADLAHLLRMLVFSAAHPMINDGQPLSVEQIVDTLLDGVRRRAGAPEPIHPTHHHEFSTTGGN